jgi:hypothetical protein
MTPHPYSDHPTTHDELGFASSVEALLDIITSADPHSDTPLTIGVFGPWGSGKTSLMHMLLDQLDHNQCIPVWFGAWRYTRTDALWRALLLAVVEGVRRYVIEQDDRLDQLVARGARINPKAPPDAKTLQEQAETRLNDLVASLYRSVEREELGNMEIDWDEAGKAVARMGVRLGFSFIPMLSSLTEAVKEAQKALGSGEDAKDAFNIFQRERAQIYRDHVTSLEQFRAQFEELVNDWVLTTGSKLMIFIDDLDRCLPEDAIGVLEAMKVFLDVPGCIFVLGIDREIIERGIRVRYKEFALAADQAAQEGVTAGQFPVAGRDYLEKIVQIPFELPPLEPDVIREFLTRKLQTVGAIESSARTQVANVMTAGLARNPRKVKRALNALRLVLALSKTRQTVPDPALLAKLVIIQNTAPALYDDIIQDMSLLKRLEEIANGYGVADDGVEKLKQVVKGDPLLEGMLKEMPRFSDISNERLQDLLFLTRAVQHK